MKITLHSLAQSAQEMELITVQHENILNVNETVVNPDYQGLTMKDITTTYSDVFKDLGCMVGALHLEVDKTVPPAIMPPCRVPLTLKDRLKEELADSPGESWCHRRRTNGLGVQSGGYRETEWETQGMHRPPAPQ